jgi:hypothetical protein
MPQQSDTAQTDSVMITLYCERENSLHVATEAREQRERQIRRPEKRTGGFRVQLISGVLHAGDVLSLFTPGEPEWGAADVGRAVGLSRSHTHRLLSTLTQIGLLDPDRRREGTAFRSLRGIPRDHPPGARRAARVLVAD